MNEKVAETAILKDSEIPDDTCRCPKCGGTFYYGNRICYSCFGTGIKAKPKKDE